jgi:peptidyl-prolyl cis-trans isomerase C
MRKVMRSMTSCAALVLLVSLSAAAQEAVKVADVGGQAITADELQMVMDAMRRSGNVDRALETLTDQGRAALLNALVEKHLYAIAAREEGLDRDADVRFWLDQSATEILARKYLEAKVRDVVVTDAALETFYRAHTDLFVTPARVKARHIVVRSREEADAVLRDAAGGGTFDRLAAERSLDTGTRAQGGDLGWITRGVMVQPFEDLVFSLKKGTVGGPVETRLGFHVVKVDDVEAPALPAFEAIKASVRDKKIETELAQLKDELTKRHPVRIER